MMKHSLLTSLLLALLAAPAFASKNDANEANFGAALSQFFAKKGELCLNTKKWPVDVSEMDMRLQKTLPGGTAGQMAALQAVGLVSGEDTVAQATGFDSKPTGVKLKVRRYVLTEAAKPYLRSKEVDSIGLNGKTTTTQTDLCWGQKALDKVVKWEGPMKLGDYQEASVTYTYKINNLAEWAKRPELQAAFGSVKALIDGAGTKTSKHGIKLTSQGWEARGLD